MPLFSSGLRKQQQWAFCPRAKKKKKTKKQNLELQSQILKIQIIVISIRNRFYCSSHQHHLSNILIIAASIVLFKVSLPPKKTPLLSSPFQMGAPRRFNIRQFKSLLTRLFVIPPFSTVTLAQKECRIYIMEQAVNHYNPTTHSVKSPFLKIQSQAQ